jgi:saccharopine dehydrogenase-like NADP-dependent oxidoreductase
VKRVAVLGAGLVSAPLVRHLLGYDDVMVTVADQDRSKAERAIGGHPRGRARALAVGDARALDGVIDASDLVVSLLPAQLHVAVAKIAVERRRPLITTSYVSPEMRALDGAARKAGVIVLNEIGLDPGLDHMSAMRVIDRVRAAGGRLETFTSCCGGLPAPDANTNPWRYKFSWSPRGVLLAGRNPARWLEGGKVVELKAEDLFKSPAPLEVPGLGRLEVYANRDSTAYVHLYGIEGVETMFRGTLRWPGWCETLDAARRLGLLEIDERDYPAGTTCAAFVETLLGAGAGTARTRAAESLGLPPDAPVIERLAWTGLFSERPIGMTRGSPLDVLCTLLQARMGYTPGERDLVVLTHRFGFVEAGSGRRSMTSTLIAYGEPRGDSAMSRTVSLPAAVAARLILDRRVALTGVHIPVDRQIYEPVLSALEPLGIRFTDS